MDPQATMQAGFRVAAQTSCTNLDRAISDESIAMRPKCDSSRSIRESRAT